MMDGPFYRGYMDLPSRPRARHSPTVREIPVLFVGSERPEIRENRFENRSESAVKIQKVFRGFLVRKSVKKIAEIRAEVEEIERRMSVKETVELIGRDSKERLRVNETLMSLLFKLDSVRGVDSGVRDCRKAVIKRIIALQEILDSVVVSSYNDNVGQMVKDDDVDRTAKDNDHVGQMVEDDEVDRTAKDECTEDSGENHDGEEIVNDANNNGDLEDVSDCCPEESVGTSQTESRSGYSYVNPESLVEACEEEEEEDDASSLKQEKNDDDGRIEEKGENVRNRELLLERMVEDNEKMMDLMAQLFKRNEMQTRLLSSLSQRVELLERAFLCERLRRKKKRQGTVDGCCDMSNDVKKCGKRL